jgi:hypothetical protein
MADLICAEAKCGTTTSAIIAIGVHRQSGEDSVNQKERLRARRLSRLPASQPFSVWLSREPEEQPVQEGLEGYIW